MTKLSNTQLDAVFQALADSTRRAMLQQLTLGACNISELRLPFDMSFAGASKHIKKLESAGLVSRSIEGREHICRLEPVLLAEASAWLRHYEVFWNKHLDLLEEELQQVSTHDSSQE